MKKALLLLSAFAIVATAQEATTTEKPVPVYAKTTPHPVVEPVIKQDAAPRKSKPATEQKAKAPANTTNSSTK